jgi:hypothetical protein
MVRNALYYKHATHAYAYEYNVVISACDAPVFFFLLLLLVILFRLINQ